MMPLAAAALLAAAPALTREEAQTLPLPALAQRVLGAAGTLVVDVERPVWPQCVGLCVPQPPHADGDPPPLTTLTFHTRATASGEAGWLGLCRATAIDVSFDGGGVVTGLSQGATVGWLGALTRAVPGSGATGVAATSAQYAGLQARCGALATTRDFVSADWPTDAERALIAVSLVHDSMAAGGSIRVTCTIDVTHPEVCGTRADLRTLAADVDVAKITGVEAVDPRTGHFVTGGAEDDGCYVVRLAQSFGQSDQITLCLHVTGDALTVTRAAFSRGRVVY